MENILENKAKFFAQYWGQKVFFSVLFGSIVKCESYYLHKDNIQENDHLSLKPIFQITDEDASVIGSYRYKDPKMLTHVEIGKALIKEFLGEYNTQIEGFEVDYLRSKGYALPWMGLSVEQMVDYGWVKLTT